MSGYGEVVRETPAQAHERKVAAIEAVLVACLAYPQREEDLHWLAEECLAAAETGF